MSHNYSYIHDYLPLPIDQKSIAVGAAAADDYRMSIRITKSVPASVYCSVVILHGAITFEWLSMISVHDCR